MKKLYNNYTDVWQCFNPSGNLKNMTNIVKKHIKNYDYVIDENGNIFIGDFNKKLPCLVSHLDSVHVKKSTKFNLKNDILSSNNGIGGDDKCGIIAILEILKINKNVNAIFTVDEEIGGVGANLIQEYILKNVKYFIEIDRMSNDNIIFNSGGFNMASDDFKNDVMKVIGDYDYFEEYGSFTDINILCETALKSGFNISAGYYKAHTVNEYVNLKDLNKTILTVNKILNNLDSVYDLDISLSYQNEYIQEDNYTLEQLLNNAYMRGYDEKVIDIICQAYDIGYSEALEESCQYS